MKQYTELRKLVMIVTESKGETDGIVTEYEFVGDDSLKKDIEIHFMHKVLESLLYK